MLRADEIRKIVKSHGQVSKEVGRGQEVITDIDFGYIPEVIGNPELIENGGMYFNKPVLKFTRGERTIVTVVSKKHLDVYTQTMYIRRKKKKALPLRQVMKISARTRPKRLVVQLLMIV